ncbi:hypothetical protein NMG29_38430 [Streptomyces cocklensis]|uniref:Uncharacterized protein n=1 Tax=Actinacidiphila cocklensis TaxID=887465 RepID=A0A9W4GVN7_9ACTN|nr:hypothetical protein [Actinacidiphila cocklensis]MDD1063978.1 hypothetical protein [Actinacidiphila cocklensis]WSX78668.1 hypothetical protein OH826_35385 [Streptomyces sp. NBC_00899]CAG6396907.1 hypothetical protein SCOCK_490020 [Actinacidiphila cocklensis]
MNDGNGRRFREALLLGVSITVCSGLIGLVLGVGAAMWLFAGILGVVATLVIFCWTSWP